MTLTDISHILLAPESSNTERQVALDQFALLCSRLSDIEPDPSYSAWSNDTFLSQGVAINPKAAAYCIKDYRRSMVFIQGIFSALQVLKARLTARQSIKVLYAGCGPFATLLLPLLPRFEPSELDIHLLDIHPESLKSVAQLLKAFGLDDYKITLIEADACHYQHTNSLDLIIVETMQKALEQEPQFSVTTNLATQLNVTGIFVPEKITIELCLAHLDEESEHHKKYGCVENEEWIKQGLRHPIRELMQLSAAHANDLIVQTKEGSASDKPTLPLGQVSIPDIQHLKSYQALLFTRIHVYGEASLDDYDCSLTLPSRCFELEPLEAGATYHASYALGGYPKIQWQRVDVK